MILRILIIFLLINIAGCSGFEFVYNNDLKPSPLEKRTAILATGDNIPEIKNELNNILGKAEEIDFKLSIVSKQQNTDVVKEENMTASLIQIKQTIEYELTSIKNKCIVGVKTISNSARFNSKSEGYNFGSDLSKKELIKDLINQNIREYLNYLSSSFDNLNC